MTVDEIRQKFLEFFEKKDHRLIVSDSLVPKDDPTVLFTTAGMQQFKKQFMGHLEGYTRAVTSQKCLRTDDLDEVGKTDFHHTFFEMLGNFSFGDYFKKEAIAWAWEFLTEVVKIQPEKLWISVYKDDDEAYEIWSKNVGVPTERIVKLGDKSNFWPANAKQDGPNGPCGPCSEIYYDYGPIPAKNQQPAHDCDPSCECGRFSEIWNLVFTQYNRQEDGELKPLPNKNIDTGMGLERLASVLQGHKNNFEIDIFQPILAAIEKHSNCKKALPLREKRIIADHLRAITFGIQDGVIPSNEGRGYVIKRLIIDCTDILLRFGQQSTCLYQMIPAVMNVMQTGYPEILNKRDIMMQMVEGIEKAYIKVRRERQPELLDHIKTILGDSSTVDEKVTQLGHLIFKYRDTYGLTPPSLKEALENSQLDEIKLANIFKVYEEHMRKQQMQSRAASQMQGDVFLSDDLSANLPKTKFEGYAKLNLQATILQIRNDQTNMDSLEGSGPLQIVLDQTSFYAESGGQVGDQGVIKGANFEIKVEDTQKINDIYVHSGQLLRGQVHVGDKVLATVDQERRQTIMRHHTATHLLQAALRHVLGSHVQQQGSLVDEQRLRFDFTHPTAVTAAQKQQIEECVNRWIWRCDEVQTQCLPLAEARQTGALAFFAEKYADIVRVITINSYSQEFCGGTHVQNTGQIGLFRLSQETSVAQGIRRIEAKTGPAAWQDLHHDSHTLQECAKLLNVQQDDIIDRIQQQTKLLRETQKTLEDLQSNLQLLKLNQLIEEQRQSKLPVISYIFDKASIPMLKKLYAKISSQLPDHVCILGGTLDDKASVLVGVSKSLIQQGLNAQTLVQTMAPLFEGRGGGRADMAQAGGKLKSGLSPAIEEAKKLITKQVKI